MKVASKEVPKNVKTVLKPRANNSFVVNSYFMRIKGHIEIVNFYEQVPRYPLQELVCVHPQNAAPLELISCYTIGSGQRLCSV